MPAKSAISFGMVHIPITLHTATQDNDVHFNQLHKDDNSRVRYKKQCAHCGKEIGASDIVKGFEFDKDQYVIITDADVESIKTEQNRAMHIQHFTTLDTIPPVYYDKTYHAVPAAGGEKAYELMRSALMQEQKVAIAKTVLGTKETLIAIIPREGGLLCQTMFYADEVKALPSNYVKPEVNDEELNLAKTLINASVKPFSPEEYHDEYQQKLRDLIASKIAGKEVVVSVASSGQPQGGNVIDLMDALKQTIEMQKKDAPKRGRKKPSA